MDVEYYESLLKKPQGNHCGHKKSWDSRAKMFNHSQKHGINSSKKVTDILYKKGLLLDSDVLDIGGGTGRYAIPFSKHAKEVILTDISPQMLEHAKKNAVNEKCHNIKFVQTDWYDTNLTALNWEKRFDLVFASMCPAVRSKEGINKISSASKGWCIINQLVEMKDSLTEHVMKSLNIAPSPFDPHNDREAVQAFFNLLWADGFTPEIQYLRESKTQVLSANDALSHCSWKLGRMLKDKNTDLEELIKDFSSNGNITIEYKINLCMISWNTN